MEALACIAASLSPIPRIRIRIKRFSYKISDDLIRHPFHPKGLPLSLAQNVSLSRWSALTLKLLFLTHLRFLAGLVQFLHNKLYFMIKSNPCSVCTCFEHLILVQSQRLMTIATVTHVHICWPQTGNVESPHTMADSSSESHPTSAQNEGKHILPTSSFQSFLEEHVPGPWLGSRMRRLAQRLRRRRSHSLVTNQLDHESSVMGGGWNIYISR